MTIETLDDWNSVLGCCCEMPDFITPARINESLTGSVIVFAAIDTGGTYYRTWTVNYSGGGSAVVHASRGWQAYIGPNGLAFGAVEIDPVTLQYTNTPPLTGTPTNVYSNPVNIDSERSDAISEIYGYVIDWNSFSKGNRSTARRLHTYSYGFVPNFLATVDRIRFKWDISDHPGSWFKITWDFAFYPAGGGTAVALALDETWEWSGALGSADTSDWIYFPEAPDAGEVKIVNIRFSAYQTPYGTPIKTTGIAEDYL